MRILLVIMMTFCMVSCKTGYEVLNKGVAGNNSKDLMVRVDNDVINEQPDLVIIMVGTNDMINSKKFLTFDEYFSNLKCITTKIKSTLPRTKIVLTSILPVDEDYVFNRHKKDLFICSPNQKIDYLNTTIKKISKEQDLYFIDVNSCFRTPEMSFKNEYSLLMNSANSNADDGVHPTIKGYLIIGRHIASELKELRLVKRKMKIICFGDS